MVDSPEWIVEICPETGEEHDYCYDCCHHGECVTCAAFNPNGAFCDLECDD